MPSLNGGTVKVLKIHAIVRHHASFQGGCTRKLSRICLAEPVVVSRCEYIETASAQQHGNKS